MEEVRWRRGVGRAGKGKRDEMGEVHTISFEACMHILHHWEYMRVQLYNID